MIKRINQSSLLIKVAIFTAICVSSCTTTSTTTTSYYGSPAEKPQGFFGRLADSMTERECNVVRFSCPYGLGPAGEPCECIDPKGVVLNGTTIK